MKKLLMPLLSLFLIPFVAHAQIGTGTISGSNIVESTGTQASTSATDRTKIPLTGRTAGRVNCKGALFGTIGDGKSDDTRALNTCFAYAIANHEPAYLPAGNYKVTSSLNGTISTWPNGGFWVIGDSWSTYNGASYGGTTILSDLSVAGATIDFGGDTYGGIRNVLIESISGDKATSGILVSEGATGNEEGGQHFIISHVNAQVGDCSGCASIAEPGVDQAEIDNTVTFNGIVLGAGLGKSTAVVSQFYTLSSFLPNGNPTYETLVNVSSSGDFVPAYQLTGAHNYFGTGLFGGLDGRGTAKIGVEITDAVGRGARTNAVHFKIREENDSSATGMCAFTFSDISEGGTIEGQLAPDPAGAEFCTEGTNPVTVEGYTIKTGPFSNTAVFNVGSNGKFYNDTFNIGEGPGGSSLGTINSSSTWVNDTITLPTSWYTLNAAQTYALFPSGSSMTIGMTNAPWYTVTGRLTTTKTTLLDNSWRFYTGAPDGNTSYADFRYSSTGNVIISPSGTGTVFFGYDHGSGGVKFCEGNAICPSTILNGSPSFANMTINRGHTFTRHTIVTASLTLSSVAANTCVAQMAFVVGLNSGDHVVNQDVMPSFTAGLSLDGIIVTGANKASMNWCNNTGAAITPPRGVYTFDVEQ